MIIVLLLCLGIVSGLFGVFSTSVSPNGHPYNPTFQQCEANEYIYTVVPTQLEVGIIGIPPISNTVPTINSSIIFNSGTIHFSIDFTPEVLPGLEIDNLVGIDIEIDNSDIVNYQIDGYHVTFDRSLSVGKHALNIRWDSAFGVSQVISFEVVPYDHYFGNLYSRIIQVTNNNSLYGAVRPALFVEGFSAPGLIDGGASYTNSIITKWRNQLTDSKIYRLELANPTQDIRNNAMIVLSAIRFIHNVQPANQLLEGTSVFGYSMGGVLARYALAFAEHFNIPHYCTQYISIDAPHRGAAINNGLQDMLCNLAEWMDNNAKYFDIGNQDHNQLDPYIDGLKTPAALQLIRNNKFAENGGVGSYNTGSTTYLKLFAEINAEERSILNLDNELINSTPIDPTEPSKPGFPYKQNSIKSFAYSNGSLYPSGNHTTDDVAYYNIHIHLEGDIPPPMEVTSSDWGTASAEPQDCQPGSVIDDLGAKDECHQHKSDWWGHYDFDLNQYFAPVLVPTRSSLYLKVNNVNGSSPIFPFNISNFESLSAYQDSLITHTYFDNLSYAPAAPNQVTETENPDHPIPHKDQFNKWNWRHGELGWTGYDYDNWVQSNVSTASNWLNQPENRAVCIIKGHVTGSEFSEILGTMYIDGQANQEFYVQ